MVSHENSEDVALGSLPNAKRKRENVEVKQRNDKNVETCEFPKEDDKNLRGKQAAGKTKADANSAEPSKENYILVRAKRGQATNSHSLAER
ncbi:Transcription factor bHLH74, partial [Striga hermonthica]